MAASWKKSTEESVLPVLRRIKNATLSDSLQGGHRLIETMFMLIVMVSNNKFVPLFVFAAKQSLNFEREAKCNLGSVQKAHIYEAFKAF